MGLTVAKAFLEEGAEEDGSCFEYAEDMYRADRVSVVIDRDIEE